MAEIRSGIQQLMISAMVNGGVPTDQAEFEKRMKESKQSGLRIKQSEKLSTELFQALRDGKDTDAVIDRLVESLRKEVGESLRLPSPSRKENLRCSPGT